MFVICYVISRRESGRVRTLLPRSEHTARRPPPRRERVDMHAHTDPAPPLSESYNIMLSHGGTEGGGRGTSEPGSESTETEISKSATACSTQPGRSRKQT